MASTMVSAGKGLKVEGAKRVSKVQIAESIGRLPDWLEKNDYRGYDAFDGLNAKYLRPLTFETKFLRAVLQHGGRRIPLNTRSLLGIPKNRSKGYCARVFMLLKQTTDDKSWGDKAETALQWLIENELKGCWGACWGNHFDYQSRGFYLPKGAPIIGGTSLIGHAFLGAYDHSPVDN